MRDRQHADFPSKERFVFNSSVLEVAIGLVFLYLSMSIVCSALTEYYLHTAVATSQSI